MTSNFVIGHRQLLVFASPPCYSSSKELQTTEIADRNVIKEYDRLTHLVSHSVFSFCLLPILSRTSIPAEDMLLYQAIFIQVGALARNHCFVLFVFKIVPKILGFENRN
jgi:hypothetical protein